VVAVEELSVVVDGDEPVTGPDADPVLRFGRAGRRTCKHSLPLEMAEPRTISGVASCAQSVED
jgi:hypothetical protein